MPTWTHRILLNAADITAQTVLGVRVEEVENSSSLCDLTYYPPSGVQDSDALLLQTLVVEVDVGSGWQTIFSGVVLRATWNQKERNYRIRGSNRLQEHFRALGSQSAVLAALPGARYSEVIFGEAPQDFWEYAQRCMETLEQDLHLNRTGARTLVPWAAKGTADFALTAGDIHNNGAFALTRADSDRQVNELTVDYEYRVSRHKVRSHSISWSAWVNNVDIQSWCEWAVGPKTNRQFSLPMLPRIESAMGGGSWNLPTAVIYSTHPKSGADLCATPGWVWVNNEPEDGPIACTNASATGYRAFSQPLRETYQLKFSADASKTLYGATVSENRNGSLDVPSDPTWPPAAALPQPSWLTDTIGDAYEDQEDETNRANDLECIYQWAGWRIRGAHRETDLMVRTDLRPDIGLEHTLSIQSYGLDAKGKVRRLVYVLDGAPYTEVTIAISRGGGGTSDPWIAPSRPDTRDPGYPAPPAAQSYGTDVGGWVGAPPEPVPETRLGWITNIYVPEGGSEVYTSAFRVQWPEVESQAAQERLVDVPSTWVLSVPHDTLVLT